MERRGDDVVEVKRKVLACKCGDCTHWEVFVPAHRTVLQDAFALFETNPYHHILKCKTCGEEFPCTVSLDPHDKLSEIDEPVKPSEPVTA